MKLFHFTSLFWLPRIMREGITLGEIPIDPAVPYEKTPKAANLTTDGERINQESFLPERRIKARSAD